MENQPIILLSSDSAASSPIHDNILKNEDNDYELKCEQMSPKIINLLNNENEANIRTFSKQHRLIHDLSDSEHSDNSFSIPFSYKNDKSFVPHVLSDSEDSDRITSNNHNVGSLKYNSNKRTLLTNSTSLNIKDYQELKVPICDLQSPNKKRRKGAKTTNSDAKIKEEKLKKKEEEAKKRAERQTALKLQRQLKPGECTKYMKVVLDSALLACPFGGELLTSVQSMDCEHQLSNQDVPLSITWIRHLPDSNPVEETQMLLVWQWEQFVQSVRNHTLCDEIKNIQQKMPGKVITLVVFSIDGYFSYLKNKRRKSQTSKGRKDKATDTLRTVTSYCIVCVFSNPVVFTKGLGRNTKFTKWKHKQRKVETGMKTGKPLTESNESSNSKTSKKTNSPLKTMLEAVDCPPTQLLHLYKIGWIEIGEMELALTELQIQINCSHRLIDKGPELGLLVNQFSKSIAETPFKKEKQKREQDSLDWFALGDSRDCVRIDKEGNGLLRLWQQQLCQFNLAGIDTAQAIAAVYQSPQVLIQAYDKCETQKEGELLLQNIPEISYRVGDIVYNYQDIKTRPKS